MAAPVSVSYQHETPTLDPGRRSVRLRGPIEIASRTLISLFLLRPSDELNDMIVGVLGRYGRHPGGRHLGQHDVLMLAILASLVTTVTPELRICGFESLFWLLVLARCRRGRSSLQAAIALTAVLTAYVAGIVATKAIFDTRNRQPTATERPSLYPNDYYRLRRAALMSGVEG